MQAYYPHQEFNRDTIDGYSFDLERLAVKYGIDRLEWVLREIRIKPGQKFFPHPSEVSEALEEMVKREQKKAREANPYVPCGRCCSGMVIVEADGMSKAARCQCWTEWKGKVAR